MKIDLRKKLEENLQQTPDKVILRDEGDSLTWRELDILTGRVYAYLHQRGIGREDMVMICLKRSAAPLAAALGILRAGAAFVIVEDDYAPERIAYIKKRSDSRLTIDKEVWNAILQTEPLTGYEPVDPHDAAFSVFTSGTTGNPKGILHEYGNLPLIVSSFILPNGPAYPTPDDRFALTMPFNFIALEIFFTQGLYYNTCMYVVPNAIVKDLRKLTQYIRRNEITCFFTTPSLFRHLPEVPDCLNYVVVGGEQVGDLYSTKPRIHVLYGQSESGFALATWVPDKQYEKVPVGYSNGGVRSFILDENGNEVPAGQDGQFCYEAPFLRGYIGLSEETEKHLKNGIFYTGDLAFRDSEGRINIRGRMDDMIKISGNRVEPGEIEVVAKKLFQLERLAVRAFDDGKRAYIALYTEQPLGISEDEARRQMGRFLPYYMIPSYFVQLESLPISANGKLLRRLLPEPNIGVYRQSYAPPTDEIEKVICAAFEKVLGWEQVGIHEDFYALGGDSLSSMDLILACGLPGLSVPDVFEGRTPQKIAGIYREHRIKEGDLSEEQRDEAARKEFQPLLPLQEYMLIEQQKEPDSTILNVFMLFSFDLSLRSAEEMAKAAETALANHPSMLTQFTEIVKTDREEQPAPDYLKTLPKSCIVQHFCPESNTGIPVEHVTEAEFQKIRDELVMPFDMLDSKLCRVRVFETESSGYFFLDIHHMLFDGSSIRIFMESLTDALRGNPLKRDYYYSELAKYQKLLLSDRAMKDLVYFNARIDQDMRPDTVLMPKPDDPDAENTLGRLTTALPNLENSLDRIEKLWFCGKSVFFAAVSLAANAVYNQSPSVGLSWTYNGRNTAAKRFSTGLYLCDLMMLVRLRPEMTVREYLQAVNAEAAGGIEHSTLPFTLIYSAGETEDCMCYLYQDNLRDYGIDLTGMQQLPVKQNQAAASNVLDVEIWNGKDGLQLIMEYNAGLYRSESMERFCSIFHKLAEGFASAGEHTTLLDVFRTIENDKNTDGWFLQPENEKPCQRGA